MPGDANADPSISQPASAGLLARMQTRRAADIYTRARRSPSSEGEPMPNNVYAEIHLHISWHVKTGATIEPAFESKLHGFIRDYAGCTPVVSCHFDRLIWPLASKVNARCPFIGRLYFKASGLP